MAAVDTYIKALNLDLTRIEPEKLPDLLKTRFRNLSKKDNEALLSAIKKEIEETKTNLKTARKDLRGIEREGGQSHYGSGRSDSREDKDQISSLMDALRLLDSETNVAASQGAQDTALHNLEIDDGQDINISPVELDGETYTYTLGGGGLPAAGAPVVPSAADLTPTDFNKDGVINFSDKLAKEKSLYDPLKGQKVFINTTGQGWRLASANIETGEYTFKVTKGNEHSFIKFTDAKQVSFFFDNMELPDQESLERWPTELLKRSFKGTNENSLHDQLFKHEAPLTERLNYIPGYKAATAQEGFNQAIAQFGITGVNFDAYKKAADTMFSGIDDPSKNRQALTAEVVAQGGKELIHSLVLGVALNSGDKAKDHLTRIFGPAIGAIEGVLGDPAKYTENDKLVAMLLETQADAAGNFGGKDFFTVAMASGSGVPYIPGLMTDTANHESLQQSINAIEKYKQLVTSMGLTPTGAEDGTIEKLKSFLPKPPGDAKKGFVERLDQIKTHLQGTRSVDADSWKGFIDILAGNLFKPDGTVRDDAWQVILNATEGKGSTPGWDVAGTTGATAGGGFVAGASAGSVAGPIGSLVGGMVGTVAGAASGFVASVFGDVDQDELLSNLIVVLDAVCPFELKKQLFPQIAKAACDWLAEDSDGIFESDADNQGLAIMTLNAYLGDLAELEQNQGVDTNDPNNQITPPEASPAEAPVSPPASAPTSAPQTSTY